MAHNYDKQALNFSYLIEMVGDSPEVLVEFLETFMAQIPVYLVELDNALLSENWDKLANCAHKIKPTFFYIGRNDVRDFIQSIENKAKNRTALAEISGNIESLKLIYAEVYAQLEKEKASLMASIKKS
ncbi:Hpt domain-containing protein [Pedobacter sp. GSP4]|uniref:Hpt domain-containing protein n=1 Tax=Pedobacter sp. GSP4 TaxID=3453716 RepID=UPI003EEF609D